MSTKIIACNCKHEYQDKQHGSGKRVANYAKGVNNKAGGWRCSVCGRVHGK